MNLDVIKAETEATAGHLATSNFGNVIFLPETLASPN